MSDHVAPEKLRVGVQTIVPLDGGPVVSADLVCCAHCGYMWTIQPGSGKRRGWCGSCAGYLCGHRACVARGCVSRHQLLDNMESGRPLDFKPILVSVGG